MTVNAGSKDGKEVNASSDDDNEEPQTVSYDSHKKLLDQHKASRQKARDLQAALDAANADKVAAEEKRLADEKKFEDLYNKEKVERSKLQETVQNMTSRQVETGKRDAIKSALGGIRKDDYAKFFDLSIVQLNDDGSADAESVKAAANKFRENYPELVGGKPGAKMAQDAGGTPKVAPPKPLIERTPEELRQMLAAVSAKK